MANEKQLNILKQGVRVWNEWRMKNVDVIINLYEANLIGANLVGADLHRANLVGINLFKAHLSNANLYGADLRYAQLVRTDLTDANITGVYLYGSARDDWVIDGIKCDLVYWDRKPSFRDREKEQEERWKREHRVPKDRDFRPGEFEELYKHLPTFEYYFEQGFTPLDPLIMDQVVQAINERRPEIELKLDSFHSRGQPHAVFTVLHKDYAEDALQEITTGYETKLKVLEGQKDQLMQVIAMLGAGSIRFDTVGGNVTIQQIGGNVTGNVAGQDNIEGNKEQCAITSGRDYLEHVEDSDVTTG